MSFRVFAAGSDHFSYVLDNNPDMDIFEAAKVMSALQAMGGGRAPIDAVAKGAWSYILPSKKGASRNLVADIAKYEFLHMLKNAVTFLAMCTGVGEGSWISVAPRQSRLLWTDKMGLACYNFTPGDDPGTEFFRAINPALKATDMSNYGVLRMLAIVLSKYYDHIGSSGRPMIQIQLFK